MPAGRRGIPQPVGPGSADRHHVGAERELPQVLEIHFRGLGTQVPLGLGGDRAGHGAYPLVKAADMIDKHAEGILNYLMHPVTNAAAEGINSVIQSLKHSAHGLPKFEFFRIRVLFFLGKLDFNPAQLPPAHSRCALMQTTRTQHFSSVLKVKKSHVNQCEKVDFTYLAFATTTRSIDYIRRLLIFTP